MEQGTKVALVMGTAVLLLGTFVAVSSAQMMSQNSGQDWFGQMMNNNGGMGMTSGDHMRGMGGMMGGMTSHCQGYSGDGTSGSGNTVAISGFSFSPQTLRVRVGTTVTWTNMDGVPHSVVSGTSNTPGGVFESPLLGQGQSFSYTFNALGTYVYNCGPHPYMTGTIIVE